MLKSEVLLQVLQKVPQEPTQRSLSEALGYSIGKTNYIVKGLIEKGLVKAEKFVNSENKAAYRYILTTEGVKLRIRLTEKFIEKKKQEYEVLQKELKVLRLESNSFSNGLMTDKKT